MTAQATLQAPVTPMNSRAFFNAFIANTIWVNISGLARYFLLVTPMLHAAFPGVEGIAPVSIPVLLIWGAWTVVFLLVSTGFYWMFFDRYGNSIRSVITAGLLFSVATIALLWVAVANMGLAPMDLFYAATPFATLEQIIAAWLVNRAMKRG